jgi:hypothetical protein
MPDASWSSELKSTVQRADIPEFLVDLQRLVQALRDDQAWVPCLTEGLRAQPALVLAYLQAGNKRDAVAKSLANP